MNSHQNANPRFLIATLLLASALTVMVDTVLSPALPAIRAQFAVGENVDLLARLVLTLPSLFVAIGAPVMGALNDRIGRLPVLYASVALYGLAGGAGYVIDSITVLLASRALLGIGAAGVFVTTTALIADYFTDERRRQTVLGWQGSFITFGGVVFLSVGGVLAGVSWRVPFLIYAAALLLLPLIALRLYEPEPTRTEGVRRSDSRTGPSVTVIRHFLSRIPLRTVVLAYAVGLVSQVVFFMGPVELPFLLQTRMGSTATITGVVLATVSLSAAVTATQYERMRRQFGVTEIVALMFASVGSGWIIVSVSQTYLGIFVGLGISGIGFGVMMPNMNAWVADTVPADMRGRAFGGLTSFFFLGQFLSPFVSEPISDLIGLGMTFTVVGIGLLVLAVMIVGLRISRSNQRSRTPDRERTETNRSVK